jgi:hypothetical protein
LSFVDNRVILKPCNFSRLPNLAKFQSVNDPEKTLIDMKEAEQERVLSKLASDIENELT